MCMRNPTTGITHHGTDTPVTKNSPYENTQSIHVEMEEEFGLKSVSMAWQFTMANNSLLRNTS